jgi:hypothetical protein
MDDIAEILRLNPKAAEELEQVKTTLEQLAQLRAAGIARGSPSLASPYSGRYGKIVAPKRRVTPAFKMTFSA